MLSPSLLLCLFAGCLLPLAYAPFDIVILALLCPALLFLCWMDSSPAQAFRRGYVFGLGMFGVGVYWLHISINLFGGITLVGAIALTAALVAFLALYPALCGYIARRCVAGSESICLLLVIPALWVLAEWARSWIFTGFPWLNLGYSHVDTFLSGVGPVLGVYGISYLSVLLSAMLVAIYRCRDRRSLALLAAIILLTISSLSLATVKWTRQLDRQISVALVQAAIPQKLKWRAEMREKSLELYMALSAPYWQHDLVIWPETAIPAYAESIPGFIQRLQQLAVANNTTFLSGIPSYEPGSARYFNSVMMLGSMGPAWYHKQHLVPFGEYLPLRPLLGIVVDYLGIPMSNFSPGARGKPLLENETMKLGISICYEDTFGEEVIRALPDADILVNVSNDAWFGDSLAPHQHLQMARMRALESGRYMLRATNTGISAVIDEKGRIVKASEQFRATALDSEVALFSGLTPYTGWGNYPVVLVCMLLVGAGLLAGRRQTPGLSRPAAT